MTYHVPEFRIVAVYRLTCADGAQATVTCSAKTDLQRVKQVLEAKGTDDEFAAAADLEMQPLMTETGIHIASTLFYATHRLGGDRTLERLGGPRVQWTDHIDGSTPKDRDETIDGAIQAMTSPP